MVEGAGLGRHRSFSGLSGMPLACVRTGMATPTTDTVSLSGSGRGGSCRSSRHNTPVHSPGPPDHSPTSHCASPLLSPELRPFAMAVTGGAPQWATYLQVRASRRPSRECFLAGGQVVAGTLTPFRSLPPLAEIPRGCAGCTNGRRAGNEGAGGTALPQWRLDGALVLSAGHHSQSQSRSRSSGLRSGAAAHTTPRPVPRRAIRAAFQRSHGCPSAGPLPNVHSCGSAFLEVTGVRAAVSLLAAGEESHRLT